MLAVALTTLPGKNYRIPQAQIEAANYPAAIAALKQADHRPRQTRGCGQGVEKAAAGVKFNKAKVEALLKEQIAVSA